MAEYKLKGLSCANCAREMEEDIQKLEHGKDARLLFNSSKLIVSDEIELQKVEKILASDGAALIKQEASDGHDHDHAHAHNSIQHLMLLIGISVLIFVSAMIVEHIGYNWVAVILYLVAAALSGYTTFVML